MSSRPRGVELGIFIVVLLLMPLVAPLLDQASASYHPSLTPDLSPQLGSPSDWIGWAQTAWAYYQPGVGVNSNTGLHRSALSWHCFADWDLGSYIYAIIYARRLNLITDSGTWQFNDRISKILTFLQNRALSGTEPYLAYDWATGGVCSDRAGKVTNAADSGRLLAALYALKTFRSSYAPTVDSIFARSKSTYDTYLDDLDRYDYYTYLYAEGYVAFGYSLSTPFLLDTYSNSASYISVYGQSLPAVQTLSEPIMHILLEADTLVHQPSSRFIEFADRVNLAQRGRFLSKGLLTAWSEGANPNPPGYVYEWIIYPTKTSVYEWIIGDGTLSTTFSVPPIAYTKVAFAYLAIYGENAYIDALVNAVKGLAPPCSFASSCGFGEGVFENPKNSWGNLDGFFTDKTNELVLAAASYAQEHPNPWDFSLSNSGFIQVAQGGSGSNTITATLNSGAPQPGQTVTLTPSSLPAGATFSFSKPSGSPTFSSSLTITASPSTPTGCYSVTVTGTSGELSRTTYFTLGIAQASGGSSGVSGMGLYVTNACPGFVTFVLPDYVGPYHTPAAKCGGVNAAQLSDYSAGGYVLGLLSNPQTQILDTNPSISQADCGNPTGITGTIVTLAGPGVNKVVHYYEAGRIAPVYFFWDGARNNFIVTKTGQKFSLNTASGIDDFLVEAFTDRSGRRVFTLYGFSWQGTLAAGVYFASYVYPNLSQFPDSWYIYQWRDATGNSANSFPDPGDEYELLAWSGGAKPSPTSEAKTVTGTAYSGFAGIANDVFQASQGSVYFVLPDYDGPYHSTASKCGGVNAAALSDYSAGGYILSATTNFQNQVLDTSSLVSTASCGKFTGTTSVIVTVAGPGVNKALMYYERTAAITWVYYFWDGSKNNFIVRSSGKRYTVSAGNTVGGDDLFLLESFVDGQGRDVYVVYGFSWQGTLAAATFLNTYVRSHLSQFTNNWYIYEWKDASSGLSDNSFPDQGDAYTRIAYGNN